MPITRHRRMAAVVLAAVMIAGRLTGCAETPELTETVGTPSATLTPVPSPTSAVIGNSESGGDGRMSEAVAFVDGQVISREAWRIASAIDQAMSRLARLPAPGVEETLERLINERLVLRLAEAAHLSASESMALQRLGELQKMWGVGDTQVDAALIAAGVDRAELIEALRRLIVVEAYLDRVAAEQDASDWLAEQRRQARVSILVELAGIQSLEPGSASASETTPQVAALPPSPVPASPGVLLGDLAPDFSLSALDGRVLALSQFRNHPVVINFWASWCGPCQKEALDFAAFHDRHRERGVVVLGINLKESPQDARAFASQYGLTYPVLLDSDGAVSAAYQVRGIPTTLIVDGSGIVRARHVGPLSAEQLTEYVAPYLSSPVPEVPAESSRPIDALQLAPDFELPRDTGEIIRLSDYRGKQSVVLVFYRGST